jgi:ABC-type lipoprotein export system ATPase subunit
MVTHDPSLALSAQRNIYVRDGRISSSETGLQLAASG